MPETSSNARRQRSDGYWDVAGRDRDQDIARAICLFEQRREWQADAFLAALAEGRDQPSS